MLTRWATVLARTVESAVTAGRRLAGDRRVLAMFDQLLSSASNIIPVVLVARAVSPTSFGAFSLALVIYQLSIGVVRSIAGEPLLSLYSAEPPSVRFGISGDLLSTVVLVGGVVTVAVGLTAQLIGGVVGSALTALALALPFLLVQDSYRHLLIVDRPARAVLLDSIWLASACVAVPFVPSGASVSAYVWAWSLGGVVGVFVGLGRRGTWPSAHPLRWLTRHRGVAFRFLGEFVTARAATQVVTASLGALGGLPALGAAKAGQVYYGPHNTLHAGVYLAIVPEGARIRHDRRRFLRLFVRVGFGLVTFAGLWMLVGLSMPATAGRMFFRDTWDQAQAILLPLGIGTMAGGAMSGAVVGVRALGDAGVSLRARLLSAPGEVVCPLIGAVLDGALGFAIGFAIARIISAVVWWSMFYGAATATTDGVQYVQRSPSADLPVEVSEARP